MIIRVDKKLHLLAGMLCVSVLFPFLNIYSMAACVVFGFGKEILDKYTNQVSEAEDAHYTIAGGLIMLFFFILGGNKIGF